MTSRVALVTGGTGGIGTAMVKRLAHAHPDVAQEVRGNAVLVAKSNSGGSVDLF